MKFDVCAIVVTYKKPELLRRCIAHLKLQKTHLQTILVVDNDNDVDLRKSLASIKDVIYWGTEKNVGGAGGFYLGTHWAYKKGFKWLWLMDDDGFPEEGCLENLLKVSETEALDIAGPVVIDEENHALLSFGIGGFTTYDEIRDNFPNGMIKDRLNPFNGTLIRNSVFDKIGFIKREMFIWGDETEFLNRALSSKLRVATLTEAKHFHPRGKGKSVRLPFSIGSVVVKPKDKMNIYSRNLGYIDKKYCSLLGPIKNRTKYFLYYLLRERADIHGYLDFLKYYKDGYRNKYDLYPSRQDLLVRDISADC